MKTLRSILPLALVMLGAVCVIPAPEANAQAPEIIRIEEDWVAYIRNPDSVTAAPQIVNVISPQRTLDGAYGLVELNHSSAPTFQHGGYQVQAMFNDVLLDTQSSIDTKTLQKGQDKLQYTVAMEVRNGDLKIELREGRSRSWGRFAEDGVRSLAQSQNVDFSDYDPAFSVEHTTVNHGAHRVVVLYQNEVRYYSAAGLEVTDTTPRIIHRYRDTVTFVTLEEYENNPEYYNVEITE